MASDAETIEAPLTRQQLLERWVALSTDPALQDVAGKIELTEWGEILMSPVGKRHGLLASRVAQALERSLGGRTMVEVGVTTAIGIRAPDVAWCSAAFLAAHTEDMPLSSAPEICVEIASAGIARPKLREKATAYVNAGAVECWILFPESEQFEIHGRQGRGEESAFGVEVGALLE